MKVNYREITLVTTCPCCGRINEIEVNAMDYLRWRDGMLAQNAFPYLTAEEREMLISGICPTCWDDTFSSDEEEDPEDGWDEFEPGKFIYDEMAANP